MEYGAGMPLQRQRALGALLVVALAIVAWTYRNTFLSMVRKWGDDTSYSHGYLILPICLWLVWLRREKLSALEWTPCRAGVLVALGAAAAWVVARGTGVLVVEQLAAVALVPALVLATIGWRATRALAFPLAFLVFLVPFGRALIPQLMEITADVATSALQASGVPIYREHMLIMIPGGRFEVAKACGGLSYVITGLVLGLLYANLTYSGWKKRLVCALAFLAVPIIANGVRVYITIGVSYLTDMRYGPGAEHVTFGKLFFVLVMLGMFLVGLQWRDQAPEIVTRAHAAASERLGAASLLTSLVAICIAALAPVILSVSTAAARTRLPIAAETVTLPRAREGWVELEHADGWRPRYSGAAAERSGVFRGPEGARVDVYVGVYGLGTTSGGEMVADGNYIFEGERTSLVPGDTRTVPLRSGGELEVVEQVEPGPNAHWVVWHWFDVGGHRVVSPFAVKALEGLAFLTGSAESGRIVTLATSLDDAAGKRLEAFVHAHSDCVESGFDPETCG